MQDGPGTQPPRDLDATVVAPRVPAAHAAWLAPGTTLNQRYRIITQLGKGGMGEVYRADDLVLGVPVGLKFLPAGLNADAALLERFKGEVRVARQVSHAGVCRVYDIGDADGRLFISMEYVDGEDLSSLLRRIGRLPQDKAVEIARQLCFGLNAAHEQGVIHRDLKPANIMIDGRGNAKIMDFGIAGLAEQLAGDRAGTPRYMAPELRADGPASKRSDLFALGLVLHELFTGRHPDDTADPRTGTRTSTRPTELVKDLDPAVERVILRCLDEDPARRPGSAMAVAAALPGGDPLAAAMATGETPSPELVAHSGAAGALSIRTASALVAAFVVGMAVLLWARADVSVFRWMSLPYSGEVLAAKAAEHRRAMGYTEEPAGTAYGFSMRSALLQQIADTDASEDRWEKLREANRAPVTFWYRAQPRPLVPANWSNPRVTLEDPPQHVAGASIVITDTSGNLRGFTHFPAAEAGAEEVQEFDPGVVFRAAGLPVSAFKEVAPERTPPVASDARRAWSGELEGNPAVPVRLEMATERGRLVHFQTVYPWTPNAASRAADAPRMAALRWVQLAGELFQGVLIVTVVVLARRNLRLGRADRRGAFRIAMVGFVVLMLVSWLYGGTGSGLLGALFGNSLIRSTFFAVVWWLLYVALEPTMRKTRPHALISWSRLLEGRWMDPLVGRDLLIGALAGMVVVAGAPLRALALNLAGAPPVRPVGLDMAVLGGTGAGLATVVGAFYTSLIVALTVSMVLVMMQVLSRRNIPALIGLFIFVLIGNLVEDGRPDLGVAVSAVLVSMVITVVLARVGVLAVASMAFVGVVLVRTPAVLDFKAWYAAPTVAALVAVVAVIAWGWKAAVGGKSVFAE